MIRSPSAPGTSSRICSSGVVNATSTRPVAPVAALRTPSMRTA